MKKLYLHIGTAKTGSSALQDFCYGNAGVLEKRGIYYPTQFGGEPFNAFLLSGGNLGPLLLAQPDTEELMRIISGFFVLQDSVLLSSEYLWDHFETYQDFFTCLHRMDFTVEIIVYLRPQIDFIESMYREAVENLYGIYVDIDDFLAMADPKGHPFPGKQKDAIREILSSTDYYGHLCKLDALFGKEHIHIRLYEKAQLKNNNIYSDFLSVLGMTLDAAFQKPAGHINPTITPSVAAIRKKINSLPGYTAEEKQEVFRDVMEGLSVSQEEHLHFVSSISSRKRDEVMGYYAEANEKIAREFLQRENGVLFTKQYENPSGAVSVTQEELWEDGIKTFAALALEQNRENRRQRQAIQECREEIEALHREIEERMDKH